MAKLKIFGWQADHAGCGWYRIMLPLATLEHLELAQCAWTNDARRVDIDALDVMVGQRIFKPGVSDRWQNLARRDDRPLLVYEVDDDLLNVDPDNPAAEIFGHPQHRENMIRNMQVADLITVSTAPLAERVAKVNPRVVVLPNCIPGDLLDWGHGRYHGRVVVGWQGSPTHERDWEVARDPVQRWFARDHGVRVEMHVLGSPPSSFPRVRDLRNTPWNTDISTYYKMIDWDIALAPLYPSIFNRSKSDLRVLEAAMFGIPTIASAVPAYRNSIQDGVTGFLVSKPSDWRQALDKLLSSGLDREAMGRKAREWARTRTIEANAQRWLDAYEKARTG